MKSIRVMLGLSVMAIAAAGCTHPMRKLEHVSLGMNPEGVRKAMGAPYSVRAAKVFDNEYTTMVWEYWPPFFSLNDQKIHVVFENDKVVQWGIPGDYGTGSYSAIREYKEAKQK